MNISNINQLSKKAFDPIFQFIQYVTTNCMYPLNRISAFFYHYVNIIDKYIFIFVYYLITFYEVC